MHTHAARGRQWTGEADVLFVLRARPISRTVEATREERALRLLSGSLRLGLGLSLLIYA